MLNFVTGNRAKAGQLGRYLDFPVRHRPLELTEIQSLDLRAVVEHKAREAYRLVGEPVLVEDVSLVCHALGRLPGPLIKHFVAELGNDGLCALLDAYPDRSATAQVSFCHFDGETIQLFPASVPGRIAAQPRGETIFGWETIFVPDGHNQTWGEMTPEDQRRHSMRRLALEALQAWLTSARS